MEPIKRLSDSHDVVFAVWQDRAERDGVATQIIRGMRCWTLPNENMFALKPIIEGWGFRLVSSLAWIKPATLGRGDYWRISHEILLTAVWANRDDRFGDHGLRSWIEEPRGRHSEKPDVVREMLERASPGPRLELFARKLVPGWFAWGHEIAESLIDQTAA